MSCNGFGNSRSRISNDLNEVRQVYFLSILSDKSVFPSLLCKIFTIVAYRPVRAGNDGRGPYEALGMHDF